jgi:hypothetical protein
MRLIQFMFAAANDLDQNCAEIIRDTLWAHSNSAHGVEHITVSLVSGSVGVTLFLRHDISDPDRCTQEIVDSACAASAALRSIRITAVRF